MIKFFSYEMLGQADYGWLQARYHFSFARYVNRERMGFGVLRVVNDDIVAAGHGFDTHSHKDMEIITYVRSGAITHRDSTGNEGRTPAGDIQVMSAGSGIAHSEYNHEEEPTTLYQIWIEPKERGISPRWEMRSFPKEPVKDRLPVLVSGRAEDQAEDVLYIHQDAAISGGRIGQGSELSQPLIGQGYLLVSSGGVRVGDRLLKKGDAAEIRDMESFTLTAVEDSDVLLIDVPKEA